MQCLVCGGELEVVYQSVKDISVSSDNYIFPYGVTLFSCQECGHLQKRPNKEILEKLYASYLTDSILPNLEQVKFDSDVPKSNSYRLLENSLDFIPKKEALKMLDYGAGGGMLHSFIALFPNANIYAYDVSSHNCELLSQIAKKFWSNFEAIDEKFDFISMIYCLEHIFDIKQEILRVKELLNDEGVLWCKFPILQKTYGIFLCMIISIILAQMFLPLCFML